MNRVKILINGEVKWLTATIDRDFHGTREIRQMAFTQNPSWRLTAIKTLEANYGRSPFFGETMAAIEPLILDCEPNVAEYNIKAVKEIAKMIGIHVAHCRRSSQLDVDGSSNELLCALTREAGGDTYMCGGGASGYQDEAVFKASGVELQFLNFKHPSYPQRGQETFIPGLSIIDALVNLGFCKTSDLFAKAQHNKIGGNRK